MKSHTLIFHPDDLTHIPKIHREEKREKRVYFLKKKFLWFLVEQKHASFYLLPDCMLFLCVRKLLLTVVV